MHYSLRCAQLACKFWLRDWFFIFEAVRIFLADIIFALVDPPHPLSQPPGLLPSNVGSRQVLLFIDSGVLLLLLR